MPRWRRVSMGGAKPSATVGDSYRSLADLLLASPGTESGYRLPDGLLFVQTNGVTVAYGGQPSDLSTGPGAPIPAGAGVGIGGHGNPEVAWDLAEIWVRNSAPGSNGIISLLGPLFAYEG